MAPLKPFLTRHLRSIVTISLVVACGTAARCQDSSSGSRNLRAPMPEYIQEFFLSDAVRSQEKGEWQVTLTTESRHSVGTKEDLQIEYGLSDRLQVSVEVPYGITASRDEEEIVSGWSSINAGLLYQFIRSDRPFALSAGITMELPFHPGGEVSYEPTILLARSFRGLQIHASVLSEIEQAKPSLAYNVAAVHPIKHVWFPILEFNGRRRAQNSFYLTPGLYRHLWHRTEIGIGIPVGVGGMASPRGIVLKTNWEIGGDNEHEGNR